MKLRAIFAFASAVLMTIVFALVSGAGVESDVDSDGVPDSQDNCLVIPNPAQVDANLDGYGNICDPDIDDSCAVGAGDLAQVLGNWLAPPGPSGKSCATCPAGSGSCPP